MAKQHIEYLHLGLEEYVFLVVREWDGLTWRRRVITATQHLVGSDGI